MRELAPDATTFAPPLPGYGPEPPPHEYTLTAVADALEWRLSQSRPTHLLGHSMGAILALELARRYPGRFAGVGLAGLPVFADASEGQRFIGQRGRLYERFLRNGDEGHGSCVRFHRSRYLWAPALAPLAKGIPLRVLLAMFDHSRASHGGGLAKIVFNDLVPALSEHVTAPVALLHGDADRAAPLSAAAHLAKKRSWPLRIAKGSSHQLIFAQPRGVARWVRERLLVHPPPPPAPPPYSPAAEVAVH